MASTTGRKVIIPLTNKSGGSVAAGDVVVIDTTTDESFTTTTSAGSEQSIGVAQETIASNAVGKVLVQGYAALVNVSASATRGYYLETHTVAKQATSAAARTAGAFGQVLKAGTTPSAFIWGAADQTGGASVSNLVADRVTRTGLGTDLTTTTNVWADMDTTNLVITMTTGARRVLLTLTCVLSVSVNGTSAGLGFSVDGTGVPTEAAASTGVSALHMQTGSFYAVTATYLTDVLTAASHTFRPRWNNRTNANTVTAEQGTGQFIVFSAVELYTG